ncbi:MAG: glycosyltransferase family 39 protein [Endomicrobia bacterium]|nr:glycosyltransferase family 39 protein [Endomicrobiia bacterium]
MKNTKVTTLVFFVIFISTIFRLWYINKVELTPDECYYWEWSRKLDYSYMDQGPMLGLVIFLSTKLIGSSTEFTVRLPAVILGMFSSLFTVQILKNIHLSTSTVQLFAVLLLNLIPFIFLGQMIMTHDNVQIFFWILSSYMFYKAITKILMDKPSLKYWILTGIFCGLNLMSKYTGILLVLCVIVYLISHTRFTKFLIKKEFWIFITIVFISSLPMIVWNIKNGFPTYKYLFTSGVVFRPYTTLSFRSILEFVISQCGLMTPLIFFAFIYSIYKYLKVKNYIQNWIIINTVVVFLFFLFLAGISKFEANWPAVGYFGVVVLTSQLYHNIYHKKFGKTYILTSFVFCFLLNLVVLVDLAKPIFPFSSLGDDKVRTGKSLAEEINKIFETEKIKDPEIMLLCDYYWYAAQLAFYTKKEVVCIDTGKPLRQYSLWSKLKKGQNFLYITTDEILHNNVVNSFKKITLNKVLSIKLRQTKNFTSQIKFYVYNCHSYI